MEGSGTTVNDIVESSSSQEAAPFDDHVSSLEKKSRILLKKLRTVQSHQVLRNACVEINRATNTKPDPQTDILEALQRHDATDLESKIHNMLLGGSLTLPPILKHALPDGGTNRFSPYDLTQLIRRFEPKKFNQLLPVSDVGDLATSDTINSIEQAARSASVWADQDVSKFLRKTRTVQSQLKFMQDQVDPDATESSSGGDSSDEEEKFGWKAASKSVREKKLPITERASWLWYQERSKICSRWQWLLSQTAELDRRIKQYTEIHRQLCRQKGKFVFEDAPQTRSDAESTTDRSETCARVRAVKQPFPQRRIIRTPGTFSWNKITQRPANVSCFCSPPLTPCLLCSGRTNNCAASVDICNQSKPERAATLDPTFHPVLQQPYDIPLNLTMASCVQPNIISPTKKMMKVRNRKRRALQDSAKLFPSDAPSVKRIVSTPLGPAVTSALPLKAMGPEAKTRLRPELSNDSNASSALASSSPSPSMVARLTALPAISAAYSSPQSSRSSSLAPISPVDCESLLLNSGASPSPKPGHGSGVGVKLPRTSSGPYDIDNFVIDPSVAPPTRIEKIKYKEIFTPRWRTLEPLTESATVDSTDGNNIQEPDDDETYLVRHREFEMEECTQYRSYKEYAKKLASSKR